jgi:RNA polymerase sigma-70 factor (ECF subfamily)
VSSAVCKGGKKVALNQDGRIADELIAISEELCVVAFRQLSDHFRSYANAEEMVSRAIFKTWKYLYDQGLDPNREHIRYLALRVLRQEVINFAKESGRKGFTHVTQEFLNSLQDTALSPEETIIANEQRAKVIEIALSYLPQLPEKQREALTLHAVEGMTYEEIAKHTGMSYDAVRKNVSLARKKLREVVIAESRGRDE